MSEEELRVIWLAFAEKVWQRLQLGRELYGDRTFQRTAVEQVHEMEEELFDAVAYACMAWNKCEQMLAKLCALKTAVKEASRG